MKKLSDILYKVNLLEVEGSTTIHVLDITFDSREVKEGTLFIATKGTAIDDINLLTAQLKKGLWELSVKKFLHTLRRELLM